MTEDLGGWIQTYSGREFYPLSPRAIDVNIFDIAHALSMKCRYGGHCIAFYSVAEHSVYVSRHVAPEHALWALLHDAAEAYLADIPRPVKHILPGWHEAEERVERVIAEHFGLVWPMPPEVKAIDNSILRDECAQNMDHDHTTGVIKAEPLGIRIECWRPAKAEQEFLQRYRGLTA